MLKEQVPQLQVCCHPNNDLSEGSKPHNHAPDNLIEEKSAFFSSLKRKTANQRITATQNVVSKVLSGASKGPNKKLPNIDSISRVVQSHLEPSTQSPEMLSLVLCHSNNDNLVLFDGEAPNGTRMIVFSTTRTLTTLAD